MGGRSQANDQAIGGGISKVRYRPAPILPAGKLRLSIPRNLLAPIDEARASTAIYDRVVHLELSDSNAAEGYLCAVVLKDDVARRLFGEFGKLLEFGFFVPGIPV